VTRWLTNLRKRWQSRLPNESTTPPGQPLKVSHSVIAAEPEILERYNATLAAIAKDAADRPPGVPFCEKGPKAGDQEADEDE
jgi:hypothetical protein